ncbi:hypothetical protein [Actinomadura decatromicini]|uniref:Uncharacterized protein n=1 Tax=Actinomadura decatromicini TaxID=2604572 RepID=A0A5D3FDH4_9ACTN|nr:hypothetical protein [Actinomadura decatromicini]TYK46004.1 hypothetical protein FXF68_27730 [Actinomadura decatromicini]
MRVRDEAVALLLLRYLFPGWTIARELDGGWSAAGYISSGDLDGLLERLTAADPRAARRAVRLLSACEVRPDDDNDP